MSPDTSERLEKIIRPIVEGQIRSFLNDHPEVLLGVKRHAHVNKTAAAWVKDSLGKRIARDLVCGSTTARLVAAVLEREPGKSSICRCGMSTCIGGVRGGTVTAPDATDRLEETSPTTEGRRAHSESSEIQA